MPFLENIEYDHLIEEFRTVLRKIRLNLPSKERQYLKPYIISLDIFCPKSFIILLRKMNQIQI